MRTRVTEMLGIEFPLLAFTHCRDVAAAVSAAGGLGVLGAVAHSPEQLAVDLKWIREHAGGKPFGVDLLIPRKYAGSNEGGLGVDDLRGMIPDEHRKWIDDLLERYGVPTMPADEGGGVHGLVFDGLRYDTGDRLSYLQASVMLACEREDLGPAFRAWLADFVARS